MTPRALVFLDTETTSLRPDRRIWEAAAVVRPAGAVDASQDQHYQWFINIDDLDLGEADPKSLMIGKFYQRHPQMQMQPSWPLGLQDESYVMRQLEKITRDAIIIGAVVNFDTEAISERMRFRGVCPSWHYHLGDVENLAAGALGIEPPWGFDDLLSTFALAYNEEHRHTALGDALMARDLYDAVFKYRNRVHDMLEQAWNIIANAGLHRGGWDNEHSEWVVAAQTWRDSMYFPWLKMLYPPGTQEKTIATGYLPTLAVELALAANDNAPPES